MQYFITMHIGNPPQPLRALIDISWSKAFAFSTECADEPCLNHSRYSADASKTHSCDETRTQFIYTGLRAAGHLSKDTLTIAGVEIKNQLFHELDRVKSVPTTFWRREFDSVLGLAPPDEAWSLLGNGSPFAGMVAQGLLPRNVVSIGLGRTEGGVEVPGEITFGGVNLKMFEGEVVEGPLSNVTDGEPGSDDPFEVGPPLLNGTWRVEARGLSWGAGKDESVDLTGFTARLDTAEPFIWLPEAAFVKLREVIRPEQISDWPNSVNCEKVSELPELVFNLGGHEFVLSPFDYTLEMEFEDLGVRCVVGWQPWVKQDRDEKDFIVLVAHAKYKAGTWLIDGMLQQQEL
ncbi:acid protease [Mytilinidion resinicola]|uniref:Acid protease n=1 Tax=Mytilinidion resinicola TaxID=574789 RepID=A0A6A6YQZ0_9PEZI|nr:acid protease [Mytilinidion resinicola]KAF2810434.1 acid protease [Mytilinidion resinicola]